MRRQINKKEFQCLLYGEGKNDKDFFYSLTEIPQFIYHTSRWTILTDNSSGGSPKTVLEKCCIRIRGYQYHLILAFIDLDKLKQEYPRIKDWQEQKQKLEHEYIKKNIHIIWQLDNLEEELRKVLGNNFKSKYKINKIAKKNAIKFINSDYWKRILKEFKDKEKALDNQ